MIPYAHPSQLTYKGDIKQLNHTSKVCAGAHAYMYTVEPRLS